MQENNVKNEELKGGLMVINNEIDENVINKTTLDLNNEEDVDLLIDTLNGECDHKLLDCVDKVINVVNVYTQSRKYEEYDDEAGEVVTRWKHILILFDDKNESYVTGSSSAYRSANTIFSLKGKPTRENPIKLKVIRTDAKEKGHQYLKITIAK